MTARITPKYLHNHCRLLRNHGFIIFVLVTVIVVNVVIVFSDAFQLMVSKVCIGQVLSFQTSLSSAMYTVNIQHSVIPDRVAATASWPSCACKKKRKGKEKEKKRKRKEKEKKRSLEDVHA